MRNGVIAGLAVLLASAAARAEPPPSYHNALELQCGWAWSEGDPAIERWGPTWAVHYYLRDALALGVRGMAYTRNADSDFDFEMRRATRIPTVLDEWQWEAELTLTYAFLHGGGSLFHFDAYASGGVGVISTRPIPVVDPDNRVFDFRLSSSFGGALGVRVFVSRWFAATAEVRDFAFFAHHENATIAADPLDRATWYAPTTLADDLELQVGLSVFAPVPRER